MNHEKIIKDFKKVTSIVVKKFKSPTDMFLYLNCTKNYTRLETMIIDSAIKNMPLSALYNTLLLKQDWYFIILQSLTVKLNVESKRIKNQ